MNVIEFFILLMFFEMKHFLADFTLQTEWMLGKARPGWDFIPPLAVHCGVHALFTLGIFSLFGPLSLVAGLAAFDFGTHFLIDRVKAGPRWLGRFEMCEPEFWHVLGFDQMMHHVIGYCMILYLVSS